MMVTIYKNYDGQVESRETRNYFNHGERSEARHRSLCFAAFAVVS
jgi:hypothetical protein